MSNVNVNTKVGHPVVGILLGIAGIAVALLMTLLFGVIAGVVSGVLGIGAVLLGYFARKKGTRGMGAIVTGTLAIVLAISMTFASAGILKTMKDVAVQSGVAPTFAKYMEDPYLGIAGMAANAAKYGNTDESMKTMPYFISTLTSGITGSSVARVGAAAAAGLILFLPNFIIFFILQKSMIATMVTSGIK